MHVVRRSSRRPVAPRQQSVESQRGAEPALLSPGSRPRNQLLRHRQCLLLRRQRAHSRPLPQGQRPPRRHRHRHQAQRRHARWPQRRRPLAQGDILRTRRVPAPPRHRLRRSLPDPSLGPHHPHRGDARRPQRPGARGQGALPRRIVHVGLAVLQGALSRRPPRLVALRHHAAPLQPPLPRGGARDASALSRPGHRRYSVEPAGARQAGPSVGCGGDQALRDRRLRQVALRQNAGGRPSRGGPPRRAGRRARSSACAACPGLAALQARNHRAHRRRNQAASSATTPSPPSR